MLIRPRAQFRDLSSSGLSDTVTVENLAALKALTSRPESVVVKTGQAAGTWQWVSGSSTTANDGTVVECTTGEAGRYKRVYFGAFHAEWFGLTEAGSGTANATALQAAVTAASSAGGGRIMLPPYVFEIASAITSTTDGIHIEGAGQDTTTVYQTTTSAKIFSFTGNYCSLGNLALDYSTTPVAGGTAIYSTGAQNEFYSFQINRCYVGLVIASGTSQKAHHFQVYNYVSAGVEINGAGALTGDAMVSDFTLDAVSSGNGAQGGLYIHDGVEAALVSRGDILNGAYSIVTGASVYGATTRPAYCNITGVFFDSAVNAAYLADLVAFNFTDCWFSNGRSGAGLYGCNLGRSENVQFNGTKFVNSGSGGVYVASSAVNPQFNFCQALGNSVTTGSGVSSGLFVDANVDGLSVSGGRYGNDLFAGTQGYGINITAGCTNYSIVGADLRDNSVAALFDGPGTGIITLCKGWITENSGTGTIASGATTAVITHGLSVTPSLKDISIVFGEQGTNDYGRWSVGTFTSTQFTVTVQADPGASNLDFAWQARIL